MPSSNAATAAVAAAATTAALQTLAQAQGKLSDPGNGMTMNCGLNSLNSMQGMQLGNGTGLHNLSADMSATLIQNGEGGVGGRQPVIFFQEYIPIGNKKINARKKARNIC